MKTESIEEPEKVNEGKNSEEKEGVKYSDVYYNNISPLDRIE